MVLENNLINKEFQFMKDNTKMAYIMAKVNYLVQKDN